MINGELEEGEFKESVISFFSIIFIMLIILLIFHLVGAMNPVCIAKSINGFSIGYFVCTITYGSFFLVMGTLFLLVVVFSPAVMIYQSIRYNKEEDE